MIIKMKCLQGLDLLPCFRSRDTGYCLCIELFNFFEQSFMGVLLILGLIAMGIRIDSEGIR